MHRTAEARMQKLLRLLVNLSGECNDPILPQPTQPRMQAAGRTSGIGSAETCFLESQASTSTEPEAVSPPSCSLTLRCNVHTDMLQHVADTAQASGGPVLWMQWPHHATGVLRFQDAVWKTGASWPKFVCCSASFHSISYGTELSYDPSPTYPPAAAVICATNVDAGCKPPPAAGCKPLPGLRALLPPLGREDEVGAHRSVAPEHFHPVPDAVLWAGLVGGSGDKCSFSDVTGRRPQAGRFAGCLQLGCTCM